MTAVLLVSHGKEHLGPLQITLSNVYLLIQYVCEHLFSVYYCLPSILRECVLLNYTAKILTVYLLKDKFLMVQQGKDGW